MHLVVDRISEVLGAEPRVLLPGRVSSRRPRSVADTPCATVSLELDTNRARGLGRVVRPGHSLASHTQSVAIQASPGYESGTFNPSLTAYKLWPLPLRKNPSSTQAHFSASDISIVNLNTNTAYVLADQPQTGDQFSLNPGSGEIRFGAPQLAGHSLEIQHWTLVWRDDIVAERYSGRLCLTLWSDQFQTIDDVGRRLTARLYRNSGLLKEKGFEQLNESGMSDVVTEVMQPLAQSAFEVWRQQFYYQFSFDSDLGGETSQGGVIRRIDVDFRDKLPETFSIVQ